ncbi:MAG: hypothetical protein AB8F26_06540 [Phycisphaerales bacterium]
MTSLLRVVIHLFLLSIVLAANIFLIVVGLLNSNIATTAIGIGGLFFVWIFARGLVLSVLSRERLFRKHLRPALDLGTMESSQGTWACEIDHEFVRYDWLEHQHSTMFPLKEIDTVALVHGRIALLHNGHLRSHLPDDADSHPDLAGTILARIRVWNPHAELIDYRNQSLL